MRIMSLFCVVVKMEYCCAVEVGSKGVDSVGLALVSSWRDWSSWLVILCKKVFDIIFSQFDVFVQVNPAIMRREIEIIAFKISQGKESRYNPSSSTHTTIKSSQESGP